MILTDVHTHSTHSSDGISSLKEMAEHAFLCGVKYYGVSEHFDRDYTVLGIKLHGLVLPNINERAYFNEAFALKKHYQEKGMTLLAGGEFGYLKDGRCFRYYSELIDAFSPDFVVNSVHTVDGADCYFPDYFKGKEKNFAYRRYLETVLDSLSAPYRYNVVAHIGYVSRNAPYPDKRLNYCDFKELYDEILKGIISRGKILEVNSSTRGADCVCLPDQDVLARYFELGGRAVSFASDAHNTARICAGRKETVALLKEIGFTYITVPCGKTEVHVPI